MASMGPETHAARDPGAECGEIPGHAEVDAAAATGDEHRLAFEQIARRQALDEHLVMGWHEDALEKAGAC
jgi:hypothetical protein